MGAFSMARARIREVLPVAEKLDGAEQTNVRLQMESELEFTTLYSPSPNTSQLAARMKVRRTLRSLGEGGLKGFEEFRKDTSELCSEELHFNFPRRVRANNNPAACSAARARNMVA